MSNKKSKKRFFPNSLTILNMFLGFSSIILIMKGEYFNAGILILLAGLMDIFDGKIIQITDFNDPKNGEKLKLISIFLSVFNVHTNRMPIEGKFKSVKYVKGDFLAAFDHKASDKNERMEISIDTKFGSIIVKQIAGLVARRIFCYAKKGEKMSAGDRLGYIRFGSRTDIILPANINLNIKMNQKVYGGETILGNYE